MQLKQRNKIWIICLVIGTLLLGMGIQAALAVLDYRRSRESAAAVVSGACTLAQNAVEEVLNENKRLEEGVQAGLEKKKLHAVQLANLNLLILVNPWNPIPEGYEPELQDIGQEMQLDVRCADALLKMIEDCRAAGGNPYICSAYRTQSVQEALYNNKILRLTLAGVNLETAPTLAARSVAVPGTSEHQLGLAVDIIDEYYTNLDAGQEKTSTQQWLMENSWRYGFILRYPNGSTDLTGIIYEPWHYRYVGREYAQDIYEQGVTLEEYVALRRGR